MHIYNKYRIIHNKKQNHLLDLLINCTYVRSAPQILSSKDECTFLSSNFLFLNILVCVILHLIGIIYFLIADLFRLANVSDRALVTASPEVLALEDLISKIYKLLQKDCVDILHDSGL